MGDLLGKDVRQEIPEDFASGKSPAATPDRGDKQAAQIEAAVQKSLHKFADALQPVLLSLTRFGLNPVALLCHQSLVNTHNFANASTNEMHTGLTNGSMSTSRVVIVVIV